MLESLKNWCKKIRSCDSTEQSDNEYQALTPCDKITNGDEYLNALKWAIEGNKAKNIALSGPYGSGKSSVIETFLSKDPSIKDRAIKISMATFVEEMIAGEGELNKQSIPLEKDEIEKSILKQLFYKVDHKKIPQSRYRKLHRIDLCNVFWSALILVLACLVVGYVFWPDTLKSGYDKVIEAGAKLCLANWFTLLLAGLFIIGCLFVISKLYRAILSKIKVKEVKLPKDFSIQNDTAYQETVFNKNLDEIVYFFEETKYNVVFFEDLDRLNNATIFVHLRELSIILNNCETIKEPVVFIYAVRDDIFSDIDRTKFFDFIIPIVPVINSTNSGEILLQRLSESEKQGKTHDISEEFVMDVSPYISDMRILQNIYNEFVVYKATLTTGQNLKLLDKHMFALIIFKNLYPRDFAELQREQGIVKQAFNDKENFISGKKQELQERIEESTKILERIESELFDTRKQLKYSFLCELTDGNGVVRLFKPNGKSQISAVEFLADDYDVYSCANIDSCQGTYINWNNNSSSFTKHDFKTTYDKFIQNYQAVSVIEDDRIEEEKALVETLKRQIFELKAKTLSELIDLYGKEVVLSENVNSNDLLVFLLRRGYIDEKYVDYINYFKATTITNEDMNYILGVKNMSPHPFNYRLTRTDLVIQRLQPYEFEQEVIYNFDLLECLLSSDKYEEKLKLLIKQLSNGSENSWSFIDEFVDSTRYQQRFIQLLMAAWNEFWDFIYNNAVLTLERKFHYLSMLISYGSIEVIEDLNTNGAISAFFVDNYYVLQRLSSIENRKLMEVVAALKIKFVDLETEEVSTEVLDYVFDNNCYCLNADMIQRIVEYKDKELVPSLETKNYSTLLKLGYMPLLKYTQDNIEAYIDDIVLSPSNVEEDIHAIIKLLKFLSNADRNNRHIRIIENERFQVGDISAICSDLWEEDNAYVASIWNAIIENEKLEPTWKNLYAYWSRLGHTEISIDYMCKNTSVLLDDDSTCIEDKKFIGDFIESNIDGDSFAKLLPKLQWPDFDIALSSLDESKVEIMVSQEYFDFMVERYKELAEISSSMCADFVIANQSEYMEVNEQLTLDVELFEALILDNRFARINAQRLIDEHSTTHMTSTIACRLGSLGVKISIDIFEAAWELLETTQKEQLMFENLSILDADKFEKCFSDLGREYTELSDRSRRHEVALPDSEEILVLAEKLRSVGYITSFQRKDYKYIDEENGAEKVISKLVCRVKAIT